MMRLAARTTAYRIAVYLNIPYGDVIKIQEWAYVWWVQIRGKRPTLVSKKKLDTETKELKQIEAGAYDLCELFRWTQFNSIEKRATDTLNQSEAVRDAFCEFYGEDTGSKLFNDLGLIFESVLIVCGKRNGMNHFLKKMFFQNKKTDHQSYVLDMMRISNLGCQTIDELLSAFKTWGQDHNQAA